MIKVLLVLALLLVNVDISSAVEKAGEINKYKGNLKVYKEGEIWGQSVKKRNHELFVKDVVKTKRRAMAHITFIDGSEAYMKEKSILEIEKIKDIAVGEGRVIFNVKEQGSFLGWIIIRTKTAVIGVKGTKFLVDVDKDKLQIYLKEGALNIKSVEDAFIRYRKKEGADYEDFKKNEIDEFKKFKETMEEEFKEFVKEFDMEGGTAISIDGKEVRDIAIPEEIEKEFLLFSSPEVFDES